MPWLITTQQYGCSGGYSRVTEDPPWKAISSDEHILFAMEIPEGISEIQYTDTSDWG